MTHAIDVKWRPVVGYEELYWISTDGRVYSVPRKNTSGGILTKDIAPNGYHIVHLYLNGHPKTVRIHQLVAAAFIGPRPTGMQVRHLDGNKSNNHISNLAYGTPSQNEQDKRSHGTNPMLNRAHCSQGHEYTATNTYTGRGYRECRTCKRERARAQYRAKQD